MGTHDARKSLGSSMPGSTRRKSLLGSVLADVRQFAQVANAVSTVEIAKLVLSADSFHVLTMSRVRTAARQSGVIGVNRALRLAQTALYGIEIGKDVELGEGVYFVHTLGIILGGDAKIGNRVRFMGNNTVGTAKDNGYPIIEDDVVVGAGARILGPIRVGAGAIIGANAVVLSDVPPGATVVGIPAREKSSGSQSTAKKEK
jgi:serine O-acetyltransferase